MKTIMYVEDHPPAQLLMQAIVGDFTAHQLVLASTGEEALKIAAAHHPDLYILDFDLPDTSGVVLAQALQPIHAAPVILVSAYAESVKLESAVQLYLAKPLDPDHVAEVIQKILG
jgi:two-component system cell cycle response regulator DivK